MTMMNDLLRAARGVEPADLVFKGGRIVNVFSGELETADLAITGETIVGVGRYQGREEVDATGRYLAPGFIDAHFHLESSMVTPAELTKAILPRGTTALVADPHEIANVLGLRGINYLIESSAGLPVDFFFMAPSCVPATHLETSGAELGAEDLRPLLAEPRVLGLAEVMNFPGVIHGRPEVLAKLDLFRERPLDGHAPLVSGSDLCAYVLPGIETEHECTNLAEAREKLARGMRILIREGSQAKNLEALRPLITPGLAHRLAFCTDDRHPEDLVGEGHLDHVLRRAVALGVDPILAVTVATLGPARAFGLKKRGALAPGYLADIVVLDSLVDFGVSQVYKGGRLVAEQGQVLGEFGETVLPDWAVAMKVKELGTDRFRIPAAGPRVRVIEVMEGQVLTGSLVCDTPTEAGLAAADPGRDLALLAVVERHHGTGNIGLGLVKGLGLGQGALASSVAHDSHNIVAAGVDPEDIHLAVARVIGLGGGLVVAAQGRVLAELALPLAGLMSTGTVMETAQGLESVKSAARELGCALKNPFMALSFLALPVIPRLKLTDQGLVDVEKFDFVPLFVS
jgi:adenine deaminase